MQNQVDVHPLILPMRHNIEKRMTNRKHISDVLIEGKSLKIMKVQAISVHGG